MEVFRCSACGDELSAPIHRVSLLRGGWLAPGWHDLARPVLMEPGTYALDDGESHEFPGVRGTFLLAPGDLRGTRLVVDRCGDGCIGIAPEVGGNVACDACGAMVGSRTDACGTWQSARLSPAAVERVSVDADAPAAARVSRDALAQFAWERTYRDTFGEGPGWAGTDQRKSTLWRATVIECLTTAVSPEENDVIVFVGARSAALSVIAAALFGAGRVRHVGDVRDADVSGAAQDREDAATFVSLELSTRLLAPLARRFTGAVLVNVHPHGNRPPANEDEVRRVALDDAIWRYLVRAAGVDRTLSGARWRKPGLAAETYRDDPEFPEPARTDLESLAREFGWDRPSLSRWPRS